MQPTRVLFVCHGNICRSVSAQYMLQHMVNERGLSDRFVIDSAAGRNDEIGNPIYPPARLKLVEHGGPIGNHRAIKITKRAGGEWDLIVGMDVENMRDLKRIHSHICSTAYPALEAAGELTQPSFKPLDREPSGTTD